MVKNKSKFAKVKATTTH